MSVLGIAESVHYKVQHFFMLLSADDIAECKALFKKETGKDITDAKAAEYAEDVIGLVRLVASPPSNDLHS